MTFSVEKPILWIEDLYFSKEQLFKIVLMNLFLTNTQLFASWTGSCGLLDYCDVFIRFLDSHSDGTHSLQRIHWWSSDVMLFLQICSDEETNSSTSCIAWGWVNIQQIFISGWTILNWIQVKSSWALLSFRYMWGHTVERDAVPHRTTVLHKYRHTTL